MDPLTTCPRSASNNGLWSPDLLLMDVSLSPRRHLVCYWRSGYGVTPPVPVPGCFYGSRFAKSKHHCLRKEWTSHFVFTDARHYSKIELLPQLSCVSSR